MRLVRRALRMVSNNTCPLLSRVSQRVTVYAKGCALTVKCNVAVQDTLKQKKLICDVL